MVARESAGFPWTLSGQQVCWWGKKHPETVSTPRISSPFIWIHLVCLLFIEKMPLNRWTLKQWFRQRFHFRHIKILQHPWDPPKKTRLKHLAHLTYLKILWTRCFYDGILEDHVKIIFQAWSSLICFTMSSSPCAAFQMHFQKHIQTWHPSSHNHCLV